MHKVIDRCDTVSVMALKNNGARREWKEDEGERMGGGRERERERERERVGRGGREFKHNYKLQVNMYSYV